MKLGWIAIFAGLVALLGINAAYLVAAFSGKVVWCVPYLEGCVSISKAGRQVPAVYVYRSCIIPAATLMAVYWWLNYRWMCSVSNGRGLSSGVIGAFGIFAAVSLIIYGAILGASGPEVKFFRRYGALGFFLFTGLAQIFFAVRVHRLASKLALPRPAIVTKTLIAVALLVFVGLDGLSTRFRLDALQNAVEWNVASAMALYFISTAWVWRATGYDARPSPVQGEH